jgi:hypothetical protein
MTLSSTATTLVVDDKTDPREVVEEYFVAVVDRIVGLEMGADDELPFLPGAVRRVVAGSSANLERSAK